MGNLPTVKIQGAGLIGTSCALALKQFGYRVSIYDENPAAQALARDLLNAQLESELEYQVVIVAVPVSEVLSVIKSEYSLNPKSIFLDVASTKAELQLEIEGLSELRKRFLGSHPMAGREVS